MKIAQKRLYMIDSIRGFSILSMIGYHACWFMNFFGLYITNELLYSNGFNIWERTICCAFIFIAGFSFSLSRYPLKNALIVSAIGFIVSLFSYFFLTDIGDIFGVLCLIGSAGLIFVPMDKYLLKNGNIERKYAVSGTAICLIFLIFTWKINRGYLGIESFFKIMLPSKLYDMGYIMTYIGFLDKDFYSVDYFSIFPWIFLYGAGYFANKSLKGTEFEEKILTKGVPFLKNLGRYSLLIYLIHPVVLFIIFYLISRFFA